MNFAISHLKRANVVKIAFGCQPGVPLVSQYRGCSCDNGKTTAPESSEVDADLPLQNSTNPFEREKIKCVLCEHNIEVNYKNVRLLSQFVSRYTGKVYGRHITRLCQAQQERVERAIHMAQTSGLMGTYTRDITFAKDPKLFNPDQPIRPHRF